MASEHDDRRRRRLVLLLRVVVGDSDLSSGIVKLWSCMAVKYIA